MFIKPHNTPFSLVESFYPHETGKGYQLLQKQKMIHTLHSWMLLKVHQEGFCKPGLNGWEHWEVSKGQITLFTRLNLICECLRVPFISVHGRIPCNVIPECIDTNFGEWVNFITILNSSPPDSLIVSVREAEHSTNVLNLLVFYS